MHLLQLLVLQLLLSLLFVKNDTFRLAAYPGQELSLTGLEVTDQADVRTVASVYVTVVDPKVGTPISSHVGACTCKTITQEEGCLGRGGA